MAAAQYLAQDSFWVDKSKYEEAERQYYERLGHASLTPLAAEIAKARQRIIDMKREVDEGATAVTDGVAAVVGACGGGGGAGAGDEKSAPSAQPASSSHTADQKVTKVAIPSEPASKAPEPCNMPSIDAGAMKFLEKKMTEFAAVLSKVQADLEDMKIRVSNIENSVGAVKPHIAICPAKPPAAKPAADDDDDVDLFGSESEDDEAAAKVREERLAAYNAKKSKKPALVAKSSIILDVKPWDDETDMKKMEAEVRKIECEGLLWGASKLVPLAFGIHKLQISCVVEDEKVSIDWLQEQIESNEDFVQSVDIAAFNKI